MSANPSPEEAEMQARVASLKDEVKAQDQEIEDQDRGDPKAA